MKITRAYVGKVVEVQWRDPNFRRCEQHEVIKGLDALATWREFGVVHDVTDGVVQVVHSAARNVGSKPGEPDDELAYTSIHEALIERITVFQPVTEATG